MQDFDPIKPPPCWILLDCGALCFKYCWEKVVGKPIKLFSCKKRTTVAAAARDRNDSLRYVKQLQSQIHAHKVRPECVPIPNLSGPASLSVISGYPTNSEALKTNLGRLGCWQAPSDAAPGEHIFAATSRLTFDIWLGIQWPDTRLLLLPGGTVVPSCCLLSHTVVVENCHMPRMFSLACEHTGNTRAF